VEHGLRWAAVHFHPHEAAKWLLVPGDHPVLDPGLVRTLLESCTRQPRYSIVVPTHGGRRGHPALIAWAHAAGIQKMAPGHGIDAYLRLHAAETLELQVDNAEILLDLDTPEDYARLKANNS
jgi:CTP:molybdopterin cytidylyltransferase MocA